MKIKSFLGLVEIRTKLASLIPFILGTLYAIYRFHAFNLKNFGLLFISILTFDMVTTAINNYFDYKKAQKKQGYNYESHNAIVRDQIKESTVILTIFILFAVATLFGIILFFNTNITILFIGMTSFLVGILYSFGPVPISRTPLGEMFSGFFMGFVIVFLSVYIHVYDQNIVFFGIENFVATIRLEMLEVLFIFLLAVPTMCGIANIMLANNICDIEDDLENRRYTLPIYIGKKNALWIFRNLHYITYVDIVILTVFRLIPPAALLSLLTVVPVNKNIRIFYKKQTKKDTFDLSVKNFMLISAALVFLFGISMIVELFLKR